MGSCLIDLWPDHDAERISCRGKDRCNASVPDMSEDVQYAHMLLQS